jgi:uncharacterized protein YbjT (DUF2867 family)
MPIPNTDFIHNKKTRNMPHHHIAILGGSGFVGRHLAHRLAQEKHTLTVITRRRESARPLMVLPGLTVAEADIHDPAALASAVSGSSVIINLIGILNEFSHPGKQFTQNHEQLPRRLVEICRQQGVRRLLHMSALGADPAYGASHYLRSKGEGEGIVHSAHDINVTSFRPSVIFGEDDSFFNRFASLLRTTPLMFPLACPNARFAPVYVGDVVEAFARSLDNSNTYGQRFELCGPHSYTLKELVSYTADQLGLRRRIIGLSDPLSRLQARLLEWAPGKPFTRDNYLSMQQPSLCKGEFPPLFGILPRSIETMVPTYLGGQRKWERYDQFRSMARR